MKKHQDYDFSGWATRNNLMCSDGRRIIKDAFIDDDGITVPLVWNHQHDDVFNVLGHALLENRDEGVYAYCKFNSTESGQDAKEMVKHGDVKALSIYANKLKQRGSDVVHGAIREVSLVLAGANPGAFIDSIVMAHGEDGEEEAIIYTGEEIALSHSEKEEKESKEQMADEVKNAGSEEAKDEKEKTVEDVFNTLTDEQKEVVYALIGQALEDAKNGDDDEDDEEEDSEEMKHNVFDQEERQQGDYLSHSDIDKIFASAKRNGSLKEAVNDFIGDDAELMHSIDTTGMETPTGNSTYGFNDPSMLFPDYKDYNKSPEWISRNMDWVADFMGGLHHIPFSRIRSRYANITEDEARAKGYIKGNQKRSEVFTVLKRTTDPQTIYKLQKLDRDDIIDITDFDTVAWIKAEMRVMLNEEIVRAALIGDGRLPDAEDKISEAHVRPIATDVPLFNTKVKIQVAANATNAEVAKATIDGIIRGRKHYKGSGKPTFYTTEDQLTEMLLLEDSIGHKLYKDEAALATTLRVSKIVTVEPMEGYTVTEGSGNSAVAYPLVGVIVNPADYNVGADKGGEVNLFDDFDIDFNKYTYLIETRISGALVKPYSALTILLDRAAG